MKYVGNTYGGHAGMLRQSAGAGAGATRSQINFAALGGSPGARSGAWANQRMLLKTDVWDPDHGNVENGCRTISCVVARAGVSIRLER